ncbi:hypothetical protein EYF80_010428 [Liparis tanakae]|uniref:Uncharacterized protein n=1 Tax=Liparis tanakae TaxID=230148 RepID=A0A4Z2IPL0_9TELE|nr:hypothetical protein EYF80_010428 [Liparis tanakae]
MEKLLDGVKAGSEPPVLLAPLSKKILQFAHLLLVFLRVLGKRKGRSREVGELYAAQSQFPGTQGYHLDRRASSHLDKWRHNRAAATVAHQPKWSKFVEPLSIVTLYHKVYG